MSDDRVLMQAPALTWLGHATVLLDLGGVRLLTDPVLRARVGHLRRETPRPPTVGPVDAVLLSHAHGDHLDLPTLREVAADTPVLAPRGAARLARRAGLTDVREVAAGDEVEIGRARVRTVAAVHDGRRHPLASGGGDAVGFVVEAERRVYFAGDTELFDGMRELGGELDAALLPVWGWGSSLGPGHMDPAQAAAAAALLRPALAIPIHWGTLLALGVRRRRAALLSGPGPEFAAEVARVAPEVRVEVLAPGDTIGLQPARPAGG